MEHVHQNQNQNLEGMKTIINTNNLRRKTNGNHKNSYLLTYNQNNLIQLTEWFGVKGHVKINDNPYAYFPLDE